MSFRSGRIILVLLFAALAVTACAGDAARQATCRNHRAGIGELTECG